MAGAYRSIYIEFEAGTQKLGKALKSIESEASDVNSQLKEVNKGLKLDPENTELTAKKFTLLNEGIKNTESRLALLRKAQAEYNEELKKADPKSAEYADMTAKMESLNKEIERSEQRLKNFRKEAAETRKEVGEKLKGAIDDFASTLKPVAAGIGAIITALGGLTVSAASSGDELNTLSKVTGLSVETLQEFQFASKLIDVSTETFSSSLRKLTMNMENAQSGTGSAYEAFSKLNVSVTDSTGALRNNEEVFYDVIDALGRISNETERDALSMEIFGRSAQQLNPLILAGSDALREYGDQAKDMGLVFDGETIDQLQEFNDKLDITKQQFKGMKTIIGAEMTDAFDEAFGGADKLLKLVQQAKADGTLKTIASDVASALEALITILSTAAKVAYALREEITFGVTAFVSYKAAMGINNIVKAVQSALTALKASYAATTAATEADTAAQEANKAARLLNANTIAGLGAAFIALAMKYKSFVDNMNVAPIVKLTAEVEELSQKCKEATEQYNELLSSNQKEIDEISANTEVYSQLALKVEELSEKENLSSVEKKEMLSYIDQLNEKVPGLNLAFDETTNSLNLEKDALDELISSYGSYMEYQARLANGVELRRQQIELQRIYDQQKDEIERLKNEIAALEASWNTSEDVFYGAERWQQLNDSLAILSGNWAGTGSQLRDINDRIEENSRAIQELSEETTAYSDSISEVAESTEKAAESQDKAKSSEDKLANAYNSAKSAVSTYRSELTNLISVLSQVQSGTAYSTAQILDLIDKYPELCNQIQKTADGYTIEEESVKSLAQAKADLLYMETLEQMKLVSSQLGNGGNLTAEERARLNEEYGRLRQQLEAYQTIGRDIANGEYYNGSSGSSSSGTSYSSGTADNTDYYKQEAEEAIASLKHSYEMGQISAEEYYDRLEELNRAYYAGLYEYIDQYRKYEEEVYKGRFKLQEELNKEKQQEISNAKELTDRLRAVREAEAALENARNQKVQTYSSAAGFHAEADAAAVQKANDSLLGSQLSLAEKLEKLGLSGSFQLPGFSALLPDLSSLRLPTSSSTAAASNSTSGQITVNYQAGDIIIQAPVDNSTVSAIRQAADTGMRELFERYLTEFFEKQNIKRMTGGR